MVVNESAILICVLVEGPNGWQAKVCETVTEFRQVFLTKHFSLSAIGSSGHNGGILNPFALCSL
jgi:hypothetical protein